MFYQISLEFQMLKSIAEIKKIVIILLLEVKNDKNKWLLNLPLI